MSEINVNDPGIPFAHFYELPDGVRIPAMHPKDVQMEGGVVDGASPMEKLRDSVRSTVAEKHRPMLADLSYHHLQVMQSAYTGWLAGYYMAVSKLGAGAQSKAAVPQAQPPARAPQTARPSPASHTAAGGKGKNITIEQPYVELRPGVPLPGMLGGHVWGTKEAAARGRLRFQAPIGQPVTLPSN